MCVCVHVCVWSITLYCLNVQNNDGSVKNCLSTKEVALGWGWGLNNEGNLYREKISYTQRFGSSMTQLKSNWSRERVIQTLKKAAAFQGYTRCPQNLIWSIPQIPTKSHIWLDSFQCIMRFQCVTGYLSTICSLIKY